MICRSRDVIPVLFAGGIVCVNTVLSNILSFKEITLSGVSKIIPLGGAVNDGSLGVKE